MNDNHYMKDMDLPTVIKYLENLSKKLKRQEGTIPMVEAVETAIDLLSTHTPLKSCPFCGSGNVRLVGSITNTYIPIHYVICRDCECRGASKKTEEQAIKVWNRRVNDDQRTVNPEDG